MTTVFKVGEEARQLGETPLRGRGDCSEFGDAFPGVTPFRRLRGTGLLEVGEADLHAYVDGELDPKRRSIVEAVLALNPLLRGRVEAFRAINADLKGLFADELPPMSMGVSRLSADLERKLAQIVRRSRRRALLARIRALAAGLLRWNHPELDGQSPPLR